MRRRFAALVTVALAAGVLALGPTADAGPIGQAPIPKPVGNALGICDPLDPAHCLLPFPNDHFTVADPSTATGLRVNLSPLAMPSNVAGKPWDTTEWNRNDGWSPGSPILTRVPGLDLQKTWGIDRDQLTDLSLSMRPDVPIVLLDATTGKRHPFWSELDTHPDTADADRLLIIRPARNLEEGHRYVVALRDLEDRYGSGIYARGPFVAIRDGKPAPVNNPGVDLRRPAIERALADLEAAGIERRGLYLAWDFTVASERNLTERALSMRDQAFALLGDDDLADRVVTGLPPATTISEVRTEGLGTGTARTVHGTVAVPNFLSPQHEAQASLPAEVGPLLEQIEDSVPEPANEALGLLRESLPVAAPLSRLQYGADGLPAINPLQPTVDVPFDCHLPLESSVTNPDGLADVVLYGHGLLGSRGEAGGSSTEDLRLRGFAVCAVDWWGMSTGDLATVAAILLDVSNFPALPDRAQQGFLNFLFLGRALAHPDGLAADPAFQDDAGAPLIRTGSVAYAGNSQGGIMGGSLTALAPDFTRAILGVPGMNYSTLLNRSVDWEGSYAEINYAAYPSKLEQQLVFALMQMLWDRGEANGYAHHIAKDPLPDTPSHQVLLQAAYADHQVSNVTAEVEARTIGARMVWPSFGADHPHWSVDPLYGFAKAKYSKRAARRGQSVLSYWYSADRGNTVAPTGNVPSASGDDPHGDPRKDNRASDQVAHFLRTGQLLDVCGGQPCVTTEATRTNS